MAGPRRADAHARDRCGLADRVRAADRRPRADRARRRARRGARAATRSWRRSSSGRGQGVPDNPGAWLMATAKHRAIDLIRRQATLERKYEQLGRMVEREQQLVRGRPRRRRSTTP